MTDIHPQQAIRKGEVAIDLPHAQDARLYFIGQIITPFKKIEDCPRQGDWENGPICQITVFEPWVAALDGIGDHLFLEVLYWFHLSRRDLVRQSPGYRDNSLGTFTLRSPIRPNPIGSSIVKLIQVEGNVLTVQGLDCLNGTPLIDIKPERKNWIIHRTESRKE